MEGPTGHRVFGRRNEEYIADFELICKRTLDHEEYPVFRNHFLFGADWKLCTTQLNINKGTFFYLVYRVQEKLGRVFREIEPYALFPLDQYFGGVSLRRVHASQLRQDVPLLEGTDEDDDNDDTNDLISDLISEPIDFTVVATTNVIEMPRRTDTISHHFPIRRAEEAA